MRMIMSARNYLSERLWQRSLNTFRNRFIHSTFVHKHTAITPDSQVSTAKDALLRHLSPTEWSKVDSLMPEHLTHEQEASIIACMKGYSLFVHLPTGAGKSLIFQAPALLEPEARATLVISPLVALIQVNR